MEEPRVAVGRTEVEWEAEKRKENKRWLVRGTVSGVKCLVDHMLKERLGKHALPIVIIRG